MATSIAVAFGLAAPVAALAQRRVTPEAAPAAWVSYAETVVGKVTEWLRDEAEAAARLRAYVDRWRPEATGPIILRLWISHSGVITRTKFAPFAHDRANKDLRGLLIGRDVGIRPPRGILMPLMLTVELDPVPEIVAD